MAIIRESIDFESAKMLESLLNFAKTYNPNNVLSEAIIKNLSAGLLHFKEKTVIPEDTVFFTNAKFKTFIWGTFNKDGVICFKSIKMNDFINIVNSCNIQNKKDVEKIFNDVKAQSEDYGVFSQKDKDYVFAIRLFFSGKHIGKNFSILLLKNMIKCTAKYI